MTRFDDAASRRQLWNMSGLGLELAGSIVGMALIGWALGRWAGNAKAGLLIGLAIGLFGGTYNFIRRAQALSRQAQRRYREATKDRPPESAHPLIIDVPPSERPRAANRHDWFNRSEGVEVGEDEVDPITGLPPGIPDLPPDDQPTRSP